MAHEVQSQMLISASSEFVALCQSQVALLTQGLGASLSVVYLAEELVEEGTSQAGLVPVVAYPEAAVAWEGMNLALPPEDIGDLHPLPQLPKATQSELDEVDKDSGEEDGTNEYQRYEKDHALLLNTQIVLPLIYEGVVMGLLVTGRKDRPWNEQERLEIERVAQTLAIACLLDQRRAWFEQQLSQQQRLQAKQRDLLDNLLHQLRNPLTALRTFGKLLFKRLRPGDANREVAANIMRESEHLQELLQQFDRVIDLQVDDLEPRKSLPVAWQLMPATVESTPKPIPLLPDTSSNIKLLQVTDILEPLVASAQAIAQERNLEVHLDIPPYLPQVRANAEALREVLSNLIDNALKYTPPGGKIFIQAGLERHSVQGHFAGISISDTGPGIPPQDLGHIFERRYRGVQAATEISGTGLGLAIAKELVDQMQGEIEVKSPAQQPTDLESTGGPGTTFVVWLLMS